ncbi:hypothetical protein SAMN04488134_11246 [Amphibacillus marinus]|uniref:Uncharacterized protein n=1 Tax=Amphibacillus marinus TaxID=872970 RepID=A0A1H8S9Y6_9BACI|nr:hypothetical protein [Amphibacillus marinus]SEO75184.1 hypothetical protein SAMN04488134_11246 [Amphibacillus marinus]
MSDDKNLSEGKVTPKETFTQYLENNLKIKEERYLFDTAIIEKRYYQYDREGGLTEENIFIGRKNYNDTMLESVFIYGYEPDYKDYPNHIENSWKMARILSTVDYQSLLVRTYYDNALKQKEFRYLSKQISHYKYDVNGVIIREEVWHGIEDAQRNIVEGRLAHYYDYAQNENGDYLLTFVNPAGGHYKWLIEQDYEKDCCTATILETFSCMDMYDEIMTYITNHYNEVTWVLFVEHLTVEDARFTDEEHEQLHDGTFEKKYGVHVTFN